MVDRKKGVFIAIILIMLILFLGLINIIFDLTGIFFAFEFLLLLALLSAGVALTIGVYLSEESLVWSSLLVFFGLNLINLSVLYFSNSSFSKILFPIIAGALGFLIAMVKKKSIPKNSETENSSDIETNHEENIEEKEEKEEEDIKMNFIPGKYIASETGKKYHIPRCDWAKKISKKNIVWLDDKKEAKKKGYDACKCVK